MKSKHFPYFLFAFTLLLFIGSTSLLAQNSLLQKGDRYFLNKEYESAIHYYEKYLNTNNNAQIQRKLANCYLHTAQENKALYLFEKLVKLDEAIANDFLAYAQLLKRTKRYKQAKYWFQKYAESHPNDKLIANLILSCDLINEMGENEFYITKSLDINSPQSDFVSAIYNDGLVFVSGRPNSTSREINSQTGEHYLDLYFAEKSKNGFQEPIPFDEVLNTKYHEGPACFSANNHFIYFTRNKGNLNLEGKSELNIYTARYNGEFWDKPELFQFSGQNYSIGHPSISADGRYLYFISNMEGGYGGTDIYVCYKQGFSWSYPINLGPSVNTNGNEMFPFIATDGYLYFASDGHIGFGGLDIFKTTFAQNEWTYPANLGAPFNSSKDDFSFLVDKDKTIGYFSSNRNGNDDMFEFDRNPEKTQTLVGRIISKSKHESLKDVQVILMENLSKEKIGKTDEKGFFKFDIFKGKNYSLIVSKPGFKTKRILYFNQEIKSTLKQLNIVMESTKWMKLKGNVIDQYSGASLEKANIEVVNQTYKSNIFCETDRYGDFELDVDPSKSYDIIIRKDGYFTKVLTNFKYSSEKYEQIELQKFNKNDLFELYGVNFDEGSATLDSGTIDELNTLVGIMKSNPNIVIEIIGYTDTDKGKKENKALAKLRARNAFDYLTGKGITKNRVLFKSGGYAPERSALVIKLIEAF